MPLREGTTYQPATENSEPMLPQMERGLRRWSNMLNTTLCGIKLRNPTILASGILGVSKESIGRIGKSGAGAVTLKSLCHEERQGFSNPTMFAYNGVFLNAVGLPGQGIDSAVKDFKRLDNLSVPVIGS